MIIVTGGSGLLGTAFKKILPDALYPDRKQLDLQSRESTKQYFKNVQIKFNKKVLQVVHLAAKVGGVNANMKYMSDFYQINSDINNNIITTCIEEGVDNLVCCLSTCVYPEEKYITYPLTENQLHKGCPHPSNFGYAYAKRMVDIQLKAARQQYGVNYISVIPNNMYGENDNFHPEDSHVLPALIKKVWEAKVNNNKSFEVWGDGEVYREFTYSQDIARAIIFCSENYNEAQPINIGNTREHKLKDVIDLICSEFDYNGEIVYDITKPKGQLRKPSSNEKLLNIGWKNEQYTSIEDGIRNTCTWFKDNYPNVRGI